MKYLYEFLNEAEGSLKPTDVVSYYVPDLMHVNNAPESYWDKSEEEQAKIALVDYKLIKKADIKKIKFENVRESPNGNLEFTLVGQYKVLKTIIDDAIEAYGDTLDGLIDNGTIKLK